MWYSSKLQIEGPTADEYSLLSGLDLYARRTVYISHPLK